MPFLLSAPINLNQSGTSLASYIRENIYYVDDVLVGATLVKETIEIYIESKDFSRSIHELERMDVKFRQIPLVCCPRLRFGRKYDEDLWYSVESPM